MLLNLVRVPYGSPNTPMDERDYYATNAAPNSSLNTCAGTRAEWEDWAKVHGFEGVKILRE